MRVLVVGAGGHAKVLIDALRLQHVDIIGATDEDPEKHESSLLGVPILGGDEVVRRYPPKTVVLVNGIGSTGVTGRRRDVYCRFKASGYGFTTVVHPAATVADDVSLGDGTQIMAGAVIQVGTRIGCNCIVNTQASVDHDCRIGDHVHIAPGATLSGGVHVGDGVHVGSGAVIIQGIAIGAGCVIGAGAAVIREVGDGSLVRGVPAEIELP